MNLHRLIAAPVLATGIGVVILSGAAYAATASTATNPAAASGAVPATTKCVKASARLTKLATAEAKLDARIVVLQKREDAAKAHNKTDRAAKLEQRLSKVRAARERVAKRMQRIETRCSLPAPSAPAPTAGGPVSG